MWLFQINSAASEQDTADPERPRSGYRLFTTPLQLRGRSKRWLRLYCDIGGGGCFMLLCDYAGQAKHA